jgi:hypothetical protein
MVKLVLDRSVFHGDRQFQTLKEVLGEKSRFSVRIFVTAMLIEETLGYWFFCKADEAKEHLRFLLDVTNERWFADPYTICKVELGKLPYRTEYWFMPR